MHEKVIPQQRGMEWPNAPLHASRPANVRAIPIRAGLIVTIICLAPFYWVTALGMGIVAYSIVRYVESLGRSLAIIEIMSVIASVQWLAAPKIAYLLGNFEPKYRMYVPEDVYMGYAVPGVLMLIVGMEWAMGRFDFKDIIEKLKAHLHTTRTQAYLLILAGLFAGMISSSVPPALKFVFFFIAQLKYIGALYLLLSNDRFRWLVTGGIWILTVATSFDEGMFHNLILWSAFIFSFICLELRLRRSSKWLIIILGICALIVLQSIKAEYREALLKGGYASSKTALAFDLMLAQMEEEQDRTPLERASFINARFNQGWIISAILNHVPRARPHEGGATIVAAIGNTLVPRFLVKKKAVWVSDKFMRYTGLRISKTTSMGISVLGEAYVNFGKLGGVAFMLAWGLFVGGIMRLLVAMSRRRPTLILWAPLIFLQAVKAETELLVVLNHLLKALVFTAALYFMANRILRLNI